MEWYVILFITASLILGLQLILSLLLGDLEIDHDFDIGDVFSFKGLLHFILGFSVTLTVVDKITFFTILSAIFVGLVFILGLYWVYKTLYTKLSKEIKYMDKIDNQEAEVYYWDVSTNTGQVFLTLEGRKLNIDIKSETPITLKAGEKVIVSGNRNCVHIV
jgi:hypothetical protein